MSAQDFVALLPLITLAATAVTLMLAISFRRDSGLAFGIALAGMGIALACVPWTVDASPHAIASLFLFDFFSAFYMAVILFAAIAVAILARDYMRRLGEIVEEYYILLVLAAAGACGLTASSHFATLFLSLETLSVSLYALIAYPRDRHISIEAGAKYLLLGAMSSAFLIFGMALIYAGTGQLEFRMVAAESVAGAPAILMSLGIGMFAVGVGFKLAVAPFHLWISDVYEGAPAPTTALIATISKGAVVAMLLRFFSDIEYQQSASVFAALSVVAIASILLGNFLALMQKNVKRLLAFSSIAHMGYLLVAFLAGGSLSSLSVTYYITAYVITSLGAFGVISVLSPGDRDADQVEDFRGMAWRRPWLAAAFSACLLSLAGIPLTAGFIGKFYVVAAGAESAMWTLLFVLALGSVISVYYYLRVIVAMFLPTADAGHDTPEAPASFAPAAGGPQNSITRLACIALILVMAGLLWLGVAPAKLAAMIQVAISASL